MATYRRRPTLARSFVDAQRQRVVGGDEVICEPNDLVWFRAEQFLIGSLGPGHHRLVGAGIPGFLTEWLGRTDFQLFFVAVEPVPIRRSLVAYAYEPTLHVVAELPFTLEVALRISSFDRLHSVAKGMLDAGGLQEVVENESGLVTKKAIEDAAWRLSGPELEAFGTPERLQRVREQVSAFWDRYALSPERFELVVTTRGALEHALETASVDESAEIGFGKRVELIEEDGRRRAGVIADVEGKRANVNWDDGGVSWVGSARLKKPRSPTAAQQPPPSLPRTAAAPLVAPPPSVPVPSARRAHALCADGVWRPASVLGQANGWLDVLWDHGVRAWLAPGQVRH